MFLLLLVVCCCSCFLPVSPTLDDNGGKNPKTQMEKPTTQYGTLYRFALFLLVARFLKFPPPQETQQPATAIREVFQTSDEVLTW